MFFRYMLVQEREYFGNFRQILFSLAEIEYLHCQRSLLDGQAHREVRPITNFRILRQLKFAKGFQYLFIHGLGVAWREAEREFACGCRYLAGVILYNTERTGVVEAYLEFLFPGRATRFE